MFCFVLFGQHSVASVNLLQSYCRVLSLSTNKCTSRILKSQIFLTLPKNISNKINILYLQYVIYESIFHAQYKY